MLYNVIIEKKDIKRKIKCYIFEKNSFNPYFGNRPCPLFDQVPCIKFQIKSIKI